MKATVASPLSTMRYQHLALELGSLLAELRYLGASHEDCQRACAMVETVTCDNIGAVIHDLQSQIDDLKSAAERDGIGSRLIDSFDKIEFEDWLLL